MVKSEKSRREIYNQIELKRISIETRDRQPYDLSHILPEQKYNLKLLYFMVYIYVCIMYMMLYGVCTFMELFILVYIVLRLPDHSLLLLYFINTNIIIF